MTTAARPTFEPARGGRGKGEGDLSALSKQYSSRDLPGHTKIKYRQPTQDNPEEVRARDFRRELEERERVVAREKTRERGPREHTTSSSSSSSSSKRPRLDQIPAANLDADDPLTDDDEEEENSDEDSDDDDTAALLAELEKIKKERAEEQERKEREQKAEEERIRMENILSGNPLLNLAGQQQQQQQQQQQIIQTQTAFSVKRRWDDDVVFKNCAKGVDDARREKRFINDTLRSEFHKKFMEKYEREQKAEEERIRMENILSGNPLLNLAGQQQQQQQQQQQIIQTQTAFSVKRRWDDDVVFKNCAKGVDDARREKRFINDTLRSEFHKKFMEKYVK